MTTGDADNILARLKSLVPGGWFNTVAPLRDVILGGLSDDLTKGYALIGTVRDQARIRTSNGWFLDLTGWDFFGSRVLRRTGEQDGPWCDRIIAEILRERITRRGIRQAVIDLTGQVPSIKQPWDPNDSSAYGYGYYGHATYGSLQLPNQIFVVVHRPKPQGIANIAGYGHGYYGAPTTSYISLRQSTGAIPDSEIYQMIADTKAAGVTAWVSIQ